MATTVSDLSGRAYDRVGVVIPARNESPWIRASLAAVIDAAAEVAARIMVVVVADKCDDDTVALAQQTFADCNVANVHGVVRQISAGNVGVARADGLATAIARLGERGTWLATTDADTIVPLNWLEVFLTLAGNGWHGIAGTVEVADWHHRSTQVRSAFEVLQRTRGTGDGHSHVHGANLGFSATAYLEGGGLPHLPTGEDLGLWWALQATGRPLLASGGVRVATSARHSDRTAHGFSSLLGELGERGERGEFATEERK